MEWFSKVLEWFGPFTLDSKFIDNLTKAVSIKYRSHGSISLQIPILIDQPSYRGFWGDISKDQATQLLVGKKEVIINKTAFRLSCLIDKSSF